jgi:anti-anti-sigma factor
VRIEEERFLGVVLLRVAGGINEEDSPALQERLLRLIAAREPETVGIVIDLGEVPFVSSAGLRLLMIAAKEAGKNNRRLALARLGPCVSEVFQISRFDRIIPTFNAVGDALESLSAEAAAAFRAH